MPNSVVTIIPSHPCSPVGAPAIVPMTIEVTEEPITALSEYARVPILFTVECVLDVTNPGDGPGGFALSERRLEVPYEKDYDAIPGEGPLQWPRRFNLSNWAFFMARCATRVVGGGRPSQSTHWSQRCWKGDVIWQSYGTFESPRMLDAKALVLPCSKEWRYGRSCTGVGSSRSKLRIRTCARADFMSGGDASCGPSMAAPILNFPRRSNYSGTRTYRGDSTGFHDGLLERCSATIRLPRRQP